MIDVKLAALSALLVGALLAQDLPPGVLLLSRIKRRVREAVEHLPNYSCLETSLRFHKDAGSKGLPEQLDTMRVEVLFADKKELYSPAGGSNFRDEDLAALAGYGLSGTGVFGSFLQTLFVDDHAMFTWRGEEDLGGRRSLRYDYRVPALTSGWQIGVASRQGAAGMKGSIWADADSLDLLRLEVNGDDVPLDLGLRTVFVSVDYGRTRIGDRAVMLPQTGVMRMVHESGQEARNLLEFTHCRAFETVSTLTFGEPDAAVRASASRPPTAVELPAGLTVKVKLETPITEATPIGDLIQGTVSGDVSARRKVWIPDGARVTGRIRRMYRHPEYGGYYTVGIEFTDILAGDAVFRFFADLTGMDELPEISRPKETGMADLPGVGTFFVNRGQFALPAGFQMIWKTRSAARP